MTTRYTLPLQARTREPFLHDDAVSRGFGHAKLMETFAHDFNTILSAMLLRMELLGQDPQLSGTAREDLRELATETSRARFLARYVMAVNGRPRVVRAETLDLNRLIDKVLVRVAPLIGRDASFRFEPAPETIWISGERSMVEDLITCLCLLSSHAAVRDGELVLKTECLQVDTGQRTGNFVCLSLAETWQDPANADEARRSQLALLPLKEFARQNHGWIEADHSGRKSSAIRVFLPTTEPMPEPGHEAGASRAGDFPETILVVDDEVALRRATALTLRKRGYAVLEAGNEEEALETLERHRGKIDLLLTDLLMPGSQTGTELAKKMRRNIPGLKVIVVSGRDISAGEHAEFERGSLRFLAKPYDAAELAKAVRECLDLRTVG